MSVDFKGKDPFEILGYFKNIDINEGDILEVEFFDTDIEYFGYKAFVDLSQLFFMKMLTPFKKDENRTVLRFQKLHTHNSFHKTLRNSEKYGVHSEFFNIDKNAQFSFLYHYQKALEWVDIKNKKRVLNLGVNRGDEFKVIKEMLTCTPEDNFKDKEFIGIDYCASAIKYAKENFSYDNVEFVSHDINKLDELDIGRFDLIISIGTLQSSNIRFNETFMHIYREYLLENGAVILGFPNCRWIDGEMIYGAKVPNYFFSELGLVLKDIHFCKKYLQQKRYRVTITGKDYLFLTARKIK